MSCEKLLRYDYESYDELKELVDWYMNYYNNERILSVLGKDCLYPVEAFEKNVAAGLVQN